MNVSKSLDLLMARLGNRTATGLRASCLREMQFFQENELEGGALLPWFIITENATTTTEINERRVKVPADFIREADEKELLRVVDGENDRPLVKGSWDDLLREYGDEATGAPEKYCLRGNYFMLFPKPDAEYTLKLPGYYAKQDSPVDSTSSENAWFKWVSDQLVAGTGLVIATSYLKDPELIQTFTTLLSMAKDRFQRMEVAREEANMNRSMGDD